MDLACISLGAACGAVARYKVSLHGPALGLPSPYHIAAVNVAGSFILGSLAGATLPASKLLSSPAAPAAAPTIPPMLSPRLSLMLGVGFCGSFTTFSTFSVDVLNLLVASNYSTAARYIALNNIGGVAAAGAGFALFSKYRLLGKAAKEGAK